MEVRARNSNSSNSSDSNNNLSMGELLHKAKEEERRDKRMAEKSSNNSIISAKKFSGESRPVGQIFGAVATEKSTAKGQSEKDLCLITGRNSYSQIKRGEKIACRGFQRSAKFRRNFPPSKYRILSAWSEKEKPWFFTSVSLIDSQQSRQQRRDNQ